MQPEQMLPDGVYCIAGGGELESRTERGDRIVRIITTAQGTCFLLMRTRDATHEQLREQVSALNTRVRQAEGETYRVQADLNKKERELAGERSVIGSLRQEIDALKCEVATYRELKQTLEADLAKVRAFVGDRTWKEALGHKEADA